jgi:hypothetical protein
LDLKAMMQLQDVVTKYLAIGGGFGRPVELVDFGPDPAEVAKLFSDFDEDYHISRFFHFTRGDGLASLVDGFEYTHVSIDAEIQTIL